MLKPVHRIDRFCAELRRGTPALIRLEGDCEGGQDTSTQSVLVAALETLDAVSLEWILSLAQGRGEIVLTARRARVLNLPCYDTHSTRLRLTEDSDIECLHALANPAKDLDRPLKGPFAPVRAQAHAQTQAQTEDPQTRASWQALTLCMRAGLLPAAILVPLSAGQREQDATLREDLVVLPQELARHSVEPLDPCIVHPIAAASVPVAFDTEARLYGFRADDDGKDHYALVLGSVSSTDPVLARVHSECFTGDALGSLKCDCGPQLRYALARMAACEAGVLLYLAQEGRGIGLSNKLRAYALQDQGFDTVEANYRLGFEDDHRDFRIAAAMLRKLGISAIRLMTNNPHKITAMEKAGIPVVERVPHGLAPTRQNAAYLQTKASHSGHWI